MTGRLRVEAAKVGPLSALWDLIADGEQILAGRRGILDRPELEAALLEKLP